MNVRSLRRKSVDVSGALIRIGEARHIIDTIMRWGFLANPSRTAARLEELVHCLQCAAVALQTKEEGEEE